MAPRITLVMVIHNHQPVGNFDSVFEQACERCYLPFLEELCRQGSIPVSLHYSGCLLEWLDSHRPELFEHLDALLRQGRVEMIGGAFYEPVLTMLPKRDALGQIRMNADYLESRFGQRPRGIWLAERIWEQHLTSVLAEAGVEYLSLDETHFLFAGLTEAQLNGPYLTEDEGRKLRVFPAAEKLRYLIPYAKPAEIIAYLRRVAEAAETAGRGRPCLVYADDGEKFGMWPRTYEHVYQDGWLRAFFAALEAESDWLELKTLGAAAADCPLQGLVYLPDASYREMTEWALPTESLQAYEEALESAKDAPGIDVLRRFVRGGSWRNFKVKYPEARRLYAKMIAVSEKLAAAVAQSPESRVQGQVADSGRSGVQTPGPGLEEARRELYRGQCNCAYWHGVFGGLYLPHLRSAVWAHLLRSESLIENAAHPTGPWIRTERADLDMDGREEVRLASDRLAVTVAPHGGAHITELVVRQKSFNLLDTLARRPEAYHAKILAGAATSKADQVASIHDLALAKEEGLDKHLRYDLYERQSLIDHLFAGDAAVTAEALAELKVHGDLAWATGNYELSAAGEEADRAFCRCTRRSTAAGKPLQITKEIVLPVAADRLEVRYTLRAPEGLAGPLPVRLGVEWGFALLAGRAHDRYYYSSVQANCGKDSGPDLSTVAHHRHLRFVGLRDEWLGLDLRLTFSRPADVFTYPVETISQSEAGLERVYQSSVVMPVWPLFVGGSHEDEIAMTLEVRYD